ncbi:MAG: ATP-binding protein [Lachnospiraceae bacterium]|nr:ATP-binding protein [Lachnospiraceae bacterium]
MNKQLVELNQKLHSVTVFRNVLKDSVLEAFLEFLTDCEAGQAMTVLIDAYSNFVNKLYGETENFSEYVLNLITNDENVYIRKVANEESIPAVLEESVKNELAVFNDLASLVSEEIIMAIGYEGFLPKWSVSDIDVSEEYFDRVRNIKKYGYGIYSKYHMFYVKDEQLVPVKHPDTTTLDDLIGYPYERQQIINNTKALVQGKPAANVLLFGDAGTGKSSTVKAVVNKFKDEGLRVVEIRKEQLWEIPAIIDELNSVPLKFILFIDDLSFNKGDDNFSTLKAILEGSVSARSRNVVIYATSNRRHLIKESFSDREGDDIHRNDTMQETISLSERFGLRVLFGKPDKKCYLEIVKAIAEKEGVDMSESELELLAERFALEKGGRSARGARQFVDSLLSKVQD